MIDHVKLFVTDVERSRRFYEAALEPLGYRVLIEPAPGVLGLGADKPDFWLNHEHPREHRGTAAHVAFRAESPEQVQAFHRAGLIAGGTDNGAPGPRPQYHDGYYGAYLLDMDGNNVEVVCHETEAGAG